MTPDAELLATFARTNSEDAFAELVKRHVNLVYSAALRQVGGDAHLAQDAAQSVFTDLARKAGALARRETLSGWLYTSAHFAAAKLVRTETRRRDREENFMRELTNQSSAGVSPAAPVPELEWEQLRPLLDAAMHELKEADRTAIVLRYFENRPFAEVGAQLGLNENAARMRVERALEKLRATLAQRGLATTAALATVISVHAVQVAPAGLAATFTTTAILSVETGALTLLKMMTATKLKFTIAALAVVGVVMVFVLQQRAQGKLYATNAALIQKLAQSQAETDSFSNRLALAGDAKKLSEKQFNELMKLRGEISRLRQQHNKIQSVSQVTNDSAELIRPLQVHIGASFYSVPVSLMAGMLDTMPADLAGVRNGIMPEESIKNARKVLAESPDTILLASPRVINGSGRQAQISATSSALVAGTNVNVGASLEIVSTFSTNSATFDLWFNATLTQLTGEVSQPDVETISITNQITLPLGQSLFLEKEISSGWLPNMTNAPVGPRKLLIFITPTVVDDRGNKLNYSPSNQ